MQILWGGVAMILHFQIGSQVMQITPTSSSSTRIMVSGDLGGRIALCKQEKATTHFQKNDFEGDGIGLRNGS